MQFQAILLAVDKETSAHNQEADRFSVDDVGPQHAKMLVSYQLLALLRLTRHMNSIELAERRYHDIVGATLPQMARSERYWKMPVTKILAWIDEYVLPSIEEFWERPIFRDHATWPQRVLGRGAATTQRHAVEDVDAALVAEARALHHLAGNRHVARMLDQQTPEPRDSQDDDEGIVAGDGVRFTRRRPRRGEHISYYIAKLDQMRRRDWTDLVCADDYFGPVGGMMRTTPLPPNVTEGAFVVSLSPRLFLVGDSITRCMMQRIRSMCSFLTEARQVVYDGVRAAGRPYEGQVAVEREASQDLETRCGVLQGICQTGAEAHVREACISLVQVYAEFHPAPQLDWLGVPARVREHFRGHLRHNIESTRELQTVDRIASALGYLQHLYRELPPEQSAIDAAIASGGLVLIGKVPEAYWEATRIDCQWERFRRPWELLWALATNARTASPVNDIDLYGEPAPSSTMHNRWQRLQRLLPPSLWRLIRPGADRATYLLELPINQIHLFASRTANRS